MARSPKVSRSSCMFRFWNGRFIMQDAIVFCLDVGPGMTNAPPGADTPLQSSLKIISIMLQRKIFSESKDEIAVVLFGTEETFNDLEDGESYQNITVLHPLCIPSFDLLETVAKIKPGPEETDFLDAITVGLDILHTQTQGKKIEFRRLVLFTNFDHQFSDDSLEGIIGGFQCEGEEVQLNIISPRFEDPLPSDDEDDGSGSDGEGPSVKRPRTDNRHTLVGEKPKTPQQRAGEKLIRHLLAEGVDGCAYSYDQAVLALTMFEKKSVRSMAWKCQLTLGSELAIPCAAYVKAKADSLKKSWVKCYAKTSKPDDIERQKYYHLMNNDQTEVEEENVSKGYKYGKDVIPFSKEDEAQMKYQTEEKCLSILGFTDCKNVQAQDVMDDQAHYVMAEKGDEHANTALSALIAALHRQNMCAVARYVYRKGTNPKVMVLMPKVKASYRCLVMVPLPYAEDLKNLEFPGLQSSSTPAPSSEQLDAVDRLIDDMDLCRGETELYRPQQMPNPYFQRVYQCLSHRTLNPNEAMPPPDERIDRILASTLEVEERCKHSTARMVDCFKLVKEEVKAKKPTGLETWGDGTTSNVKTEQNNDTMAAGDAPSTSQLGSAAVTSVGSINPDQDFLTLLKSAAGEASVSQVFKQLQQRVLQFVLDSFMVKYNTKVIPCLVIMKQQAAVRGQVALYNSFMKDLKSTVVGDETKKQYWDEMVANDITLLVGDGASEQERDLFLAQSPPQQEEVEVKEEDGDVDDLLDEL